MTTDNIFTSTENNAGDNQVVSTPSETKDEGLLAALVGEKQKYKTVEDLAKAYDHASSFIEQLKAENRELRDKATAAATIDDVLSRINEPKTEVEERQPTLSEKDISAMVESAITGFETKKVTEANLRKADSLMKEMFGDKAGEVFQKAASTPEKMAAYQQLASVDPEQFVALFKSEIKTNPSMDSGSLSTTAAPAAGTNRANVEGTKEWAQKVRKDNPAKYWSNEFQYELQERVRKNPSLYFGN